MSKSETKGSTQNMQRHGVGIPAILILGLCTACTPTPFTPASGTIDDGGCMATDVTPAVIETTIEDFLVTPAKIGADGETIAPAVFRTETRQIITQERREVTFATPCPPTLDVEFITVLQRALKARGYYEGTLTAQLDENTNDALRRYQAARGLNSATLSSQTARDLGLLIQ